MSGDAQPRKRKNKGKKKDDVSDEEIFTPLKSTSDEVIHVHKDIGCGGNVVTKLIFFGILAAIGVVVGVILLEYRGSSDEETLSAVDSPWSVTLQDWVDTEGDSHHDAHEKGPVGHEVEHDHEHEEEAHDSHDHEEEHDEHEESHDDHEEAPSEAGGGLFSWFGFGGEGSSGDAEEASESEAGEDAGDPMSEATEWKEQVREDPVPSVSESKTEGSPPAPAYQPPPPAPKPATPSPEPAEESPAEEEEEEEEVTGDEEAADAGGDEEEEESELEIDKEKFKELIAKYGHDTPESSDIEPSDEDIQKVDYSEGEESVGEGEESPAEVVSEDEPPSEASDDDWTGIKKSDIEKITKLDSESEGEAAEEEEEEEESEDEPPPPPQPSRQRGGPRDVEDIYPNDLITNEEDWAIREELDRADQEFNYDEFYF